MIGIETTIVRRDGDNYPLAVDVGTGIVSRPNTYYPAPLRGEVARGLFLAWVGIVRAVEVPEFIKACNRAATRQTLVTDADRATAAFRYAGIEATPVKSAGPHAAACKCPRCLVAHVGCRRFNCPVCG